MSDPRPFGPDTDEALSAALDGELAGFGAARGLAEEEVRARLDAWPGAEARRAALRAAADVVAAEDPGDRLDPHTRRRLVRLAADAAPSTAGGETRRPRRAARWAVAAAALLVALVGLGTWLVARPADTDRTVASGGAPVVVHLGTVPDVEGFTEAVAGRFGVALPPGATGGEAAVAGAEGAGATARPGAGLDPDAPAGPPPGTGPPRATRAPAALTACARDLSGRLLATARATADGLAFVATTAAGRFLLHTVALPDCRILEVRSLAGGTTAGSGR